MAPEQVALLRCVGGEPYDEPSPYWDLCAVMADAKAVAFDPTATELHRYRAAEFFGKCSKLLAELQQKGQPARMDPQPINAEDLLALVPAEHQALARAYGAALVVNALHVQSMLVGAALDRANEELKRAVAAAMPDA